MGELVCLLLFTGQQEVQSSPWGRVIDSLPGAPVLLHLLLGKPHPSSPRA